jgi:hypothetical protein
MFASLSRTVSVPSPVIASQNVRWPYQPTFKFV